MRAKIQEFVQKTECWQGALPGIQQLLPADDKELDTLIGQIVTDNDLVQFMFVMLGAITAGRVVQARHLQRGAAFFPTFGALGWCAWRMQGEVAQELVDCQQNQAMKLDMQGIALLVAAVWSREFRGGVWPPELIPQARLLARQVLATKADVDPLLSLAAITRDAGLAKILHGKRRLTEAQTLAMAEMMVDVWRGPMGEWVMPPTPNAFIAHGTTMRRAVARVSRNEPCPCGSGKKYKHCCIDKDEQRLRDSSEVAGRTQTELWNEPEKHLTVERLEKMDLALLARLDPKKIAPELRARYLVQLAALKVFDRAAEALEQLGYAPEFEGEWQLLLFQAARAGRKDIAHRLMKLRPDAAALEKELAIETRLQLVEDDPARSLALLDELAQAALRTEDSEELKQFAYGLLVSRLRAVGIFVARSLVPLVNREDAAWLFEQLLEVRDKLNLPPDDPYADICDQYVTGHDAGVTEDAAQLRKAQQLLEAKAAEVQRLKILVVSTQREIARRERPDPRTAKPVAPASEPHRSEEVVLAELRRKVNDLKSTLNERHTERNELRRELEQAYTDLDALRQTAPPPTPQESEDATREDALLLAEETATHQPIRLIEFPKAFAETLRRVPPAVARGTLTILGRLAAGESAAFVGAVRLKACPEILRRRMGIDFRLLFRLLPDRVQVVDLIPRQDLERRIKTLV